ncbi:hypothetical protein RDI58_004038 [Solanum bulbocastanum]|uniref:dihydroorotase n=1 Tax=Solanum bulbocastanum TaxID=147425 RepID=A0AAN8U5T0_SOLBU
MTLYLTDTTKSYENQTSKSTFVSGECQVVFGVKLYPAGATTNSQDGVTDLFKKCLPVLQEMIEHNMPLLVHGEVTNLEVDMFDREKVFIETVLSLSVQKFSRLKVVMEHVTTMDAVKFVESCTYVGFVAATVTPQHLVLNRNFLFQGGLQPHNYCLPVFNRDIHTVTSGSKRFFLGTDSAPYDRRRKECSYGCAGIYNAPVALSVYAKMFEKFSSYKSMTYIWLFAFSENALDKLEAFTSFNGSDFCGLSRNNSKIKLSKTPWKVSESFSYASGDITPMFAGEMLNWLLAPL